MGTVSAVNSNGTIDVTRNGDTFASVRVLSGYLKPAVNDTVLMIKGRGGWFCVGKFRTDSAPIIQRGSATTPATGDTSGTWTAVSVTFAVPFSSTPTVVATPISGVGSGSTELNWSVDNVTATGFDMRCRRNTNSVTTFGWIATNI
ncbi:H-type lectin domain-containing protein [Streptomyces sp. NRRL S-475]|uniref:H-type lectin domain-containing protein n=1 Tax=Streptomyces sp. NRRL S-475 TaxID=1463910 RepID=UPI00131B4C8C|nr:H-type lectin domain-containing protein [Streptomyces sp. NRRL S-475]